MTTTHASSLNQAASVAAPPPLVSVVIPCYNSAATIGATVESVLRQTWSALEVIVVDDSSRDDTVAVVAARAAGDRRLRVVELPRNHGAPAAPRNLGTRAAAGAWVAYLDADDLWHPRKLELQMAALLSAGATMCSAQMKDFRDDAQVAWTDPGTPRVEHVDFGMQLRKYRTPTSSIVIRRELMLAHPFNEDPSYKAREDTDCFIRAHEYMPYSLKIAHPLVLYRLQSSQISGNKLRMVKRHLMMLRKYRLKSGRALGPMAYVYTATHFTASIWLRLIRHTL
jgi:glycosyltransferase involved in cell wall biosynthesis